MLSQQVLEAWMQRIEENASARITGNAKDITELTRRLDTLEVEQAGNDRTFRELISDKAELAHRVETLEQEHTKLNRHLGEMADLWNSAGVSLAHRIERLEEKQCNLYADRVFVVNGLAQRVNVLTERIEKLEKRFKPGFRFADMEYVQQVDEECMPDLAGPGKHVELKED